MTRVEPTSADVTALDGYVATSSASTRHLVEILDTLSAERSSLLAAPVPWVVTSSVLDHLDQLTATWTENQRFVHDVAAALRAHGTPTDTTFAAWEAPTPLVSEELLVTDVERLDALEAQLRRTGTEPAHALALRRAVGQHLRAHPADGFRDAVIAALAQHQGVTVDEYLRAERAFTLERAQAVNRVADAFTTIAGPGDVITVADLQQAIDDPRLDENTRDAAYRLAADGSLFADVDVAATTDLTTAPYIGFDTGSGDGHISRDDLATFGARDHHHRILSAWLPLIDTADEDYQLDHADGVIGPDAVTTFIADNDIPLYVRLAVFDAYTDRFDLTLERREELVEEWALGTTPLATTTILTARPGPTSAPIIIAPPPGTPTPPTTPGPSGSPGPASGQPGQPGGGMAGVVIAGLAVSATLGWRIGRHLAITHTADPAIVHIDPTTGTPTRYDLDHLTGLTPIEAKAWIAHLTAHGTPPDQSPTTIDPHPYLDATGHWRWSHTNTPIHATTSGTPHQPEIAPAPNTYFNEARNEHVYAVDGEPYDGYLLSPTERAEFSTLDELHALTDITIDGTTYPPHQVAYHPVLDANGNHVHAPNNGPPLYQPRILGTNGARTMNEPLAKGRYKNIRWHLDLENPGTRPGQVHLQYEKGGQTYRHIYDFHTNTFLESNGSPIMNRMLRALDRDARLQAALLDARRWLGLPADGA